MRVFKTIQFAKFADKQKISDKHLLDAVQRANRGLIDTDLGGNVIKQRIARQEQGRAGGYRALILYKIRDKHFFVVGFAKNEQENLSVSEVQTLKKLAICYANYTDE